VPFSITYSYLGGIAHARVLIQPSSSKTSPKKQNTNCNNFLRRPLSGKRSWSAWKCSELCWDRTVDSILWGHVIVCTNSWFDTCFVASKGKGPQTATRCGALHFHSMAPSLLSLPNQSLLIYCTRTRKLPFSVILRRNFEDMADN